MVRHRRAAEVRAAAQRVGHGREDGVRGHPLVRLLAAQDLVHDDAERVDVGGGRGALGGAATMAGGRGRGQGFA